MFENDRKELANLIFPDVTVPDSVIPICNGYLHFCWFILL